ncbi:hypothetical protein GCM10023215_30400 [Pseudonocardia yuanmonensis]|uniref:Oxidoreductase n=1 Tax=Pseudonocardia yuanmonensis TaxID=1095914 RepID=A0ABP8WKP4_9PSEU
MSIDVGLLVVRLALGFVLFVHGTQKLFAWFHGPGMVKAPMIFEGLGQRPGPAMARLAATCELAAAVLLALGAAVPLGVAIAVGTMLVAGFAATLKAGRVWAAAGGGELPFVLAVMAATLAFTGPGGWSLDAATGAPWHPADIGTGIAALVVAVLAAAGPMVRTTRALRPART